MSKSDGISLMKTLQKNETRLIYAFVIVTVILASLFPTGLPMIVSEPTRKLYDTINGLAPGSVVWYTIDIGFQTSPETRAPVTVVLQHLFTVPKIKTMITTTVADGVAVYEGIMQQINKYGKTYGQDWVFLGYQTGGEMFTAAVAQDIYRACPTDNYGTPTKNIPMMANIHSAKDVSLLLTVSTGPNFYYGLRQVVAPYNTPLYTICVGYYLSEIMPFYSSGQLKGFLVGLKGGAEYESLLNMKGVASRGADAMSLIYVLLTVIIVGANIRYWSARFKGGK